MKTVRVALARNPYPVYIGAGLLDKLPHLMARHGFKERAVMVTDYHLRNRHARRAEEAFRRAKWKVSTMALPCGERAKDLDVLARIYDFLLRNNVERRTPLVALGGGTVGDAAGFAAGTFYRGIPLVRAPTTLLAQVDSAVGGKTGVNHPRAKNAVGVFHQPRLVVCDVSVLKTLPRREVLASLGEVVKYALAFDPPFVRHLALHWKKTLACDAATLSDVVARSARHKARIVAKDELDTAGVREFLNFGHTTAHALESATNYRHLLHGEAVVWGMRAAVALSRARGLLSAKEHEEAAALLKKFSPPRCPQRLRFSDIFKHLRYDKKVRGAKNVFVLLKALGKPVRVSDVTRVELKEAFREIGLML
jgi:3-dehydroquinate synthase